MMEMEQQPQQTGRKKKQKGVPETGQQLRVNSCFLATVELVVLGMALIVLGLFVPDLEEMLFGMGLQAILFGLGVIRIGSGGLSGSGAKLGSLLTKVVRRNKDG